MSKAVKAVDEMGCVDGYSERVFSPSWGMIVEKTKMKYRFFVCRDFDYPCDDYPTSKTVQEKEDEQKEAEKSYINRKRKQDIEYLRNYIIMLSEELGIMHSIQHNEDYSIEEYCRLLKIQCRLQKEKSAEIIASLPPNKTSKDYSNQINSNWTGFDEFQCSLNVDQPARSQMMRRGIKRMFSEF